MIAGQAPVGDAPDDRRDDERAPSERGEPRSARRAARRRRGRRVPRVRRRPSGAGTEAASTRRQHSSSRRRGREALSPLRHTAFTSCAPRAPRRRRETRRGDQRGSSSRAAADPRSASRTPPSARRVSREVVFDIDGPGRLLRQGAGASKDVSLRDPPQRDHGADRPVGLRQVDRAALPQPDERPRAERARRGQDPLPRRRPLRLGRRPDRGAAPDRHGLPAAEPVPEVDLRQRRLRPADPRHEGRPRRPRRAGAPAARRSGTR